MPSLFFCALFLSAGALFAQTVDGKVVDSVTGAGIAGVQVALIGHGVSDHSAETDNRGQFLIEGVAEGVYRTEFSSSGFLHVRKGMPFILVGRGPDAVHLNVQMMPWGRISGRIVDGRGDAVPRARLELTHPGYYFMGSTDDEGNFTMDRLVPPGTYTLAAVPPPHWKAPDAENDSSLGWARTYYPRTIHPEDAAKIVIPPGVEVRSLEIVLAAVPAHAVHGMIFNRDGTPASRATIHLGDSHGPLASAQSDSDGAWEFPGIVDGEWRVFAESEDDGVRLRASQWVHLHGHELKGVNLRFCPPVSLPGTVVVEVPAGAPPLPAARIALTPHGEPGYTINSPIGLPSARSDGDGNFVLNNIYPGSYRVIPPPSAPPYFLDSIRLGDGDVGGQEMELPSAGPLTLTYKSNGGAVRGTVEACGSGSVLLVPQDPALWRVGFVHSEQCSANGRYEIAAVKPGEYYAVAVNSVPATMFFAVVELDPALLRQASRVTIRSGEASQLDLRMTRGEY